MDFWATTKKIANGALAITLSNFASFNISVSVIDRLVETAEVLLNPKFLVCTSCGHVEKI